jgi:hypothetical protein
MNVTRSQFQRLLNQHCEETGFTAPELLLDYLATLLDSRLTRVDIIPDPSFAERYLLLHQNARASDFVDYADSALFFCSLMPDYGQRRGLSMDYYATLGISSYYTAGDQLADDRYVQLGNWFYSLQKFLNSAIRPDVRLELYKF